MRDETSFRDSHTTPATNTLWNAAYRRYFRLWTNLARAADLTEDEAKDVVQSVIVSILSDTDRQFDSLEHARNYVAKSVLNRVKVVKVRNRKRTEWKEEIEWRFAVPPEEGAGDEYLQRQVLRRALCRLSRRDFNILKFRFFCGFTLAQVGELLNMPISTVKSREQIILRKLQRRLRKNGF